MSDELASLYVLLTARTAGFVADMNAAEAAGARMEDRASTLMKTTALAGTAFIGASVAAGVWAVDGAAQLDQSLTRVITQAGDTVDSMASMRSTLEAMAPTVGQTPNALADAMYHAASAGYTGAAAYQIVGESAKLAAVGGSDLVDTTNAVLAVMKNAPPGVNSAADAVAQLNAIVGSGNMTMQQFAEAMGSGVIAEASGFGVSLQSLGAAMAYLTDRGVPADLAATRLRMSIALMGAPTKKAQKLLEDAGLSAADAADQVSAMQSAFVRAGVSTTKLSADMRQPDGIMVALQDLKTHMDAAGVAADEQAAVLTLAFGGGRSGSAIMMLNNNLDGVAQKYAQIGTQANSFGNSWALQQQTLTQKEHDFSAALQVTRDRLGEMLTPAASSALDWLAHTVLPDINKGVEWLGTTGEQDFQAVMGTVAPIAEAVGGGILDGFKFLTDHATVIETLFTIWAEKWVLLKSLQMANEVKNFATAFQVAAGEAGKFEAVMMTLGATGTNSIVGQWRTLTGATQEASTAIRAASGEAVVAGETLSGNLYRGAGQAGAAIEETTSKAGILGSMLSLAGPIGLGVGLLVPFVVEHWGDISSAFESSSDKLKDFQASVQKTQQDAQSAIAASVTKMGSGFAEAYGQAGASGQGGIAEAQGLQDAVNNAVATKQQIASIQAEFQQRVANSITDYGSGNGYYRYVAAGSQFHDYAEAVKAASAAVKQSDFGQQIDLMNQEIASSSALIPNVTAQWGSFSGQAQEVFNTLGGSNGGKGDTAGIAEFFGALQHHAGDATQALLSLQNSGDPAIQSILDNMKKFANVNLSSTKSGFDRLRDSILATETPQEQATQKGKDYADALARKVYPNIDAVNKSLQFEANQLTGGNIPALQALINQNPAVVTQLMNQAYWAQDAAGQWYAVGQNIAAALAQEHAAAGVSFVAPTSGTVGTRHQASGGPFQQGEFSVVGEHGPELVRWAGSGKVIPTVNTPKQASQWGGGGGGGFSLSVGAITVVANNSDPRAVAVQVRDELLNLARRSGYPHLLGSYAN